MRFFSENSVKFGRNSTTEKSEFCACWQRCATLGAQQHQADATLQAKLRLGWVLLLALRTLHIASSLFAYLGYLWSDTSRQHIRAGPDGQDVPCRV